MFVCLIAVAVGACDCGNSCLAFDWLFVFVVCVIVSLCVRSSGCPCGRFASLCGNSFLCLLGCLFVVWCVGLCLCVVVWLVVCAVGLCHHVVIQLFDCVCLIVFCVCAWLFVCLCGCLCGRFV